MYRWISAKRKRVWHFVIGEFSKETSVRLMNMSKGLNIGVDDAILGSRVSSCFSKSRPNFLSEAIFAPARNPSPETGPPWSGKKSIVSTCWNKMEKTERSDSSNTSGLSEMQANWHCV